MANVTNKAVLNRLLGKKVAIEGFKGRMGDIARNGLKAITEAQQGIVVDDLDKSVDYLVLADVSAGKTVQKQAIAFNAKGANIQVIDATAFKSMVEPTADEVLALIRAGGPNNAAVLYKSLNGAKGYYFRVSICAGISRMARPQVPHFTFVTEKFDGVDLSSFPFVDTIFFDQCTFAGATLSDAKFGTANGSDFSACKGGSATFQSVIGSRFVGADLKNAEFANFREADFTRAILDGTTFSGHDRYYGRRPQLPALPGCVFAHASLRKAIFNGATLVSPDFHNADLRDSTFSNCTLESPNFRNANLQKASLLGSKLMDANFTSASLQGANFANADLTKACFDGADMAGCNLRGAQLSGVDFSQAKNYRPEAAAGGSVGPALTELDSLAQHARRIHISFRILTGKSDDGEEASVDTNGLKHGWGLRLPPSLQTGFQRHPSGQTISSALIQLANLVGNLKVRFETVEVESTKSPKGGKELRELATTGISEAFAQAIPAAEELTAATKTWREQQNEQTAADRERREEARKKAAQEKVAEKKVIAKKIAKQVGKVTDVATFLKALELRIEKPKIDKATKMLKASGFKLFNDVTDTHLNGVVKSQTDPDLVYACRIEAEGNYACCTQNLNICGGLRGSICKHLLVLIIGLVQAGELDPTTIDSWIAKSHDTKAELNKETMGEIFIRYKGAEAGEVDWRPTQTVPEDYYTL